MSLDRVLASIRELAASERYEGVVVQKEGVDFADELRALGFRVTEHVNQRKRLWVDWKEPDMTTKAGEMHKFAKSAKLTDDEVERMVAEIRAELTRHDGRVVKYAIDRFPRPESVPPAMEDRRVISRIEALGYDVRMGTYGMGRDAYVIVKAQPTGASSSQDPK